MGLPKRCCLLCERELTWLARFRYVRFCSPLCGTQYRDKMTSLALERLSSTRLMTQADRSIAISEK
jgi:hypothetical protein